MFSDLRTAGYLVRHGASLKVTMKNIIVTLQQIKIYPDVFCVEPVMFLSSNAAP